MALEAAPTEDPASNADTTALRRAPSQRRSRERVEKFLKIATALIAEKGSDSFRMSEVATRAAVSIGSLYQYFPDKGAIIRTLAERSNAQGRACVEAELATATDEAGLRAALARVVDGYHAMFLEQPVMRDIWSATQTDRDLQAIDAEDAQAHARMLEATMHRIRPDGPVPGAMPAFLVMHLIAATVRQAVSMPDDQGKELIAAFKHRVIAGIALD